MASKSGVVGTDSIGGLVGCNSGGTITTSYSTTSVGGEDEYVGGLVGQNAGTITKCFSSGSVTGGGGLGGLVGFSESGSISNCYSSGAVSGIGYIGGLVGRNIGDITKCYSTGSLSAYYTSMGGLVGHYSGGNVSMSFWDVNTSECTWSAAGTGKSTSEMQQIATFLQSRSPWDFVSQPGSATDDIWRMCIDGVDYPRLNWQFSKYGDFICSDGVGLEDFGYFGGYWGAPEGGAVNLDGEDGIGFGDLMIFCEEWLRGR